MVMVQVVCTRCRLRPQRRESKLCQECYDRWLEGTEIFLAPDDSLFMMERQARIRRMAARAQKERPVFEPVEADLS